MVKAKHKVNYNEINVNDVLVMRNMETSEKLTAHVVEKAENEVGKLVRVRAGENLPVTIYIEDAIPGHPANNYYEVLGIVGNINKPLTTYAVSWLSEGNDGNSAGIYPYQFTTREKAEAYVKELLASEADDMRVNYDDVVVETAKGVVHDGNFDNILHIEIKEITLQN